MRKNQSPLVFCLATGTISFPELHICVIVLVCMDSIHSYSSLYSTVYLFSPTECVFGASPLNTEMQGVIPALKEVIGLWERKAYKQIITA